MEIRLKPSTKENIIDRIYENRNVENRDLFECLDERVIEPSVKYLNLERGIVAFLDAMSKHKIIMIVVDSDCDGYCSNAIFYKYVTDVLNYGNIVYVLQDDKRHGFTDKIMATIHTIRPDMVIMIDAGSCDTEQHKILKDEGIETIIIDHHDCPSDSDDCILINNQLTYKMTGEGNPTLSGGGMTIKFLEEIDNIIGKAETTDFYDLLSVSLVADVMMMNNYETRYYATSGFYNVRNEMIETILEDAGKSLSFDSISMCVAPMVNSIIRLGTIDDKKNLFRALVGDEHICGFCENEDETIYEKVLSTAKKLRRKQSKLVSELISKVDLEEKFKDYPIVVYKLETEEHKTLSGLIATRLADKYNKPCLVMRELNGRYVGSARSIPTIPNLKDALIDTDLLDYCEGHQSAFGLGFPMEIEKQFLESVKDTIKEESKVFVVEKSYEGYVPSSEIRAVHSMKGMWSKGFEEPTFHIFIKDIYSKFVSVLGKKKDTMKFTNEFVQFIKFKCNREELDTILDMDGLFDAHIIGTFNVNEWNGVSSPQVEIKELEIVNIRDNDDFIECGLDEFYF